MLKFELPLQWQTDASYLMNQRTFALLMTMSDAASRPISTASPEGAPGFQIAGSSIRIVSQLPDVAPGSTPIAFGNSHPI
jgi:HK97 family phage major capsid protein